MGKYLYRAPNLRFSIEGRQVGGQLETWLGLELPGCDLDLSEKGLIRADGMSAEELASVGVTTFEVINIPPPD